MDQSRRFLFVCGVARSGTTVLARLLNNHPQVAVGVERYKYRFMRRALPADPASLFTRERFFSYDPEDSQHNSGRPL